MSIFIACNAMQKVLCPKVLVCKKKLPFKKGRVDPTTFFSSEQQAQSVILLFPGLFYGKCSQSNPEFFYSVALLHEKVKLT